eukprot:TRINITY_DN13746_c0_g1_i1.p1 TRINITY_DN13746_c0_g1~~TRINITY_DN13746_c0_g1_i1.p1  ORF type:complete len:157 (+),score=33.83 TRINITY_DN13746_c0_g1_i1:212-682(+)
MKNSLKMGILLKKVQGCKWKGGSVVLKRLQTYNLRRIDPMGNLKGTETEKNLLKAFAGESQARNRYTYFASKAKKDGFVQIQAIFEETADQEKEHAKRLFKFLQSGEELEITAAFPAGIIGDTKDNLEASAAGENEIEKKKKKSGKKKKKKKSTLR